MHNKKLKSTQGKFLIQEVLDEWDAFDADLHSAGTYVIWDLDCVDVEDSEVVRYRKKRRAGSAFRKNRIKYYEYY